VIAEAAGDFDRLAKHFDRFAIPKHEKKKKKALAEMICEFYRFIFFS